ncbi:helix-turn-helix domain-containing protein [Burkholderia sp. MSMB0856]|uniref:helix-turn-helix domain-containing protein n=1 Tax=Burkholderia sp. MSMB0856 TaxID=1637869 RepID=UPI001F2319B2|nr:helix-turn-helix transcriptional regulator [Burkholderia sp. MSMB0856]
MGKLTELRQELMGIPAFKAGYEQQAQLVRIGRMMRDARESQGLTQAQLAERLEIAQSEISRLEKGEGVKGPTFDRIVAVAHALGLQLVVGFSDEVPPAVSASTRVEQSASATLHPKRAPRFARYKRARPARATASVVAQDEGEALWSLF